jgi:hypothetical protein
MQEAEQQRCETAYLATVERSLQQSTDLCVFLKLLASLACISVCYIFTCFVAKLITVQLLHCKSDLYCAVFSNYVAEIMLVNLLAPEFYI